MTENRPQDRRRAQTRRDILDNAHQMLITDGIAGISIRAIADRIDYTPGALYKYFPSKEALIDTVRAECYERLNAFILSRVQTAATPAQMLLTGGMAYIDYARRHPQEYHLMFGTAPSPSSSGDQRAVAMRALLQIVEMGIAGGQFVARAEYDAAAIAYHCWATVHGMASLQTAVLRDDGEGVTAVSERILQNVINGFTA